MCTAKLIQRLCNHDVLGARARLSLMRDYLTRTRTAGQSKPSIHSPARVHHATQKASSSTRRFANGCGNTSMNLPSSLAERACPSRDQ